MTLTIRAATSSDAPLVWRLLKEMAEQGKAPVFILTEEEVRRHMLGAACHCDLAFRGQAAVGIATWFWIYMSFQARRGVYIEDLFVQAAARGQGVGKALLAHLARRAHAAKGFMEWKVLKANRPALAFYQGLGAGEVPDWLNYRLEGDALARLGS